MCAVAVHAVMVAQTDPEMRAALIESSLTVPDGMPLVWAANMLGEDLPNRVYGPELMERYSERCVQARPSRVALRRPRPGLARAARAVDAAPAPGHPDRRRLLASLPRPHRGGRGVAGRADQRRAAGRPVGRHRRSEAGEVDGAHARPGRGAGHVRRRSRIRLPRRPDLAGAAVDAGARARVDLPDRPGAAPAAAALPLLQPALPGRVRAPDGEGTLAGRALP